MALKFLDTKTSPNPQCLQIVSIPPHKQDTMFRNYFSQFIISSYGSIINTYSIILSPISQSYLLFIYHEDTTLSQCKIWYVQCIDSCVETRSCMRPSFFISSLFLSFNIMPHKLAILYGSVINAMENHPRWRVGDGLMRCV